MFFYLIQVRYYSNGTKRYGFYLTKKLFFRIFIFVLDYQNKGKCLIQA